jgi:hypothetical protein
MANNYLTDYSKAKQNAKILTDLIRMGLSEVGPELAASGPNCSLTPGPNQGRCMLYLLSLNAQPLSLSCCLLTDPIDTQAIGRSAETTQQQKAVDTTSASDSESSTPAPPPAQVLYYVKREGVRDFSPTPIEGRKPWKCLTKVVSAPLGRWSVCQGERSEGYAKVSALRSLDDGRCMVAYTCSKKKTTSRT